jgi:hypothetical protein
VDSLLVKVTTSQGCEGAASLPCYASPDPDVPGTFVPAQQADVPRRSPSGMTSAVRPHTRRHERGAAPIIPDASPRGDASPQAAGLVSSGRHPAGLPERNARHVRDRDPRRDRQFAPEKNGRVFMAGSLSGSGDNGPGDQFSGHDHGYDDLDHGYGSDDRTGMAGRPHRTHQHSRHQRWDQS